MFESNHFEEHKNIFSQIGADFYQEKWGQHHVILRPVELIKWIELCKEDLGYLALVEIAAVDHQAHPLKNGYVIEVVYLLFDMGTHQRLNLHLHLNPGEIIPSITPYFSQASWMEREQGEMLGLKFDSPMENLLLPKGTIVNPLKKNVEIKHWPSEGSYPIPKLRVNPNKSETPYPEESWQWKEYGILSPVTSGRFELQVCYDPVKVVDAKARIGFNHRGFEKLLESKNWQHAMQLTDLIQPGAAPTYSTAWAKTLEEMLRIKLPERAQAIRIVMLELARVADHLTVLHEMVLAMKKNEHRLFLNAREKIYELFEEYCGHRQGSGIVRLGGVREDLPHGWIIEYQSIAELLKKNLRLIHKSLIGQRDFRDHLDHASVNAQTVLQYGVGGPAMRASGLNFDLRKSQPFYFYKDVDFDVPVGIHGTSYDRYLIRYEEIHQSLRIITQVLDNLPLGEFINPDYTSGHSLLSHSFKQLNGSWHYSGLEAPNGEAGFFILYTTDVTPHRVKIKTPSFTLAQALPEFIKDLEEWQLMTTLATLAISKSELDR